jgi:hypothetical protein
MRFILWCRTGSCRGPPHRRNLIDAQFLECQRVVFALAVGALLELGVRRFLAFSSSFTMRRLSPFSFGFEDGVFEFRHLAVDEAVESTCPRPAGTRMSGARRSRRRSCRWRCAPSPLAVAGRKVVLPGDEEPRLRIQLQELRAPLFDQMIRHDEHRLLGKPQAAQFHRGGGHGPGLFRRPRHAPAVCCRSAGCARPRLSDAAPGRRRGEVAHHAGQVRCEPSKLRSRRLLKRSLYSRASRSARSPSSQTQSRKRSFSCCCFSRRRWSPAD